MKLHEVKIANFRSAGSVSIDEVSDFNVLIGRNNAGKSTILLAIEAFFTCIKADGLTKISPPYGKKIDFTGQRLESPITFAFTFALTEQERSALLADIVREAQQLRQMVTTIESPLLVEVEICLTPPPENYSYVKSIRLRGIEPDKGDQAKTILAVSPDAARELANHQRTAGAAQNRSEEVKRLLEMVGPEDYERIKADPAETRNYIRYALTGRRLGSVTGETFAAMDQIVRSSDSFTAFRSAALNLRDQIVSEVTENSKRPLSNLLQTFSGEQSSVPAMLLD